MTMAGGRRPAATARQVSLARVATTMTPQNRNDVFTTSVFVLPVNTIATSFHANRVWLW